MILRRTHRISWMISGWIRPDTLSEENGGTACLTLGCPGSFHAVRLGFPNVTPQPWTITRVIGCASQDFADYVNPTGDSRWTPFTFAMRGRDDDRIVTRDDAPTTITVAPNSVDDATGESAEPAWTWTDWVPLKSEAADPVTGLHVLMLRALIPPRQTVCVANGQLRGLTGNWSLNNGFDYFSGGLKGNRDRITNAQRGPVEATATWQHNALANGNFFPIVQFATQLPGIVAIGTGDSHHQGTSTSEQFTGFLYRSMTTLGRNRRGDFPVGLVNCSVGGLTSRQFFARLYNLLDAVRPSFAVLPGWSYNDRSGGVNANQEAVDLFLARLISCAEACKACGTLPIFLTPFPRNREAMKLPQLVPWRQLRKQILGLRQTGELVVDATELLGRKGDGEFDGTYAPQMSHDGAHPNDRGHEAIASALLSIIANVCSPDTTATRTTQPHQAPRSAKFHGARE